MSYAMVDVEADGPIPGDYSMIGFGAAIIEPALDRVFYGRLRPISEAFLPEALASGGFTREQCLTFDEPKSVMEAFREWIAANCKRRAMFVSDFGKMHVWWR